MKNSPRILHITSEELLEDAQKNGALASPSLQGEGFIHCCTQRQLAGVVSRYYASVDKLKLVEINPEALHAELILENTMGGDELFPHVYGSINLDAVVEVRDFALNSPERMALFDND